MSKKIRLSIIVFLISVYGFAQEPPGFQIPDSLHHKTLDELEHLLNTHYQDSIKFVAYGNTLLLKAKQEVDSLWIAKGYGALSFIYKNNFPKSIIYLDSSIAISKGLNHKNYPAIAYSVRGGIYKQIGDYNKALDSYLAALKYSDRVNNKNFYYITKHNIGLLKEKTGDIEEAAKMFKEEFIYEEKNDMQGEGHLKTVLALANTYRKLQLQDSASFYNKKGVEKSLKDSLKIYYSFVLNEGINLFYKQQYQASLDSIIKAIPFVPEDNSLDKEYIIEGFLYIAKLYKHFENDQESLKYLVKIDEYRKRNKFTSLEMLESYEMLINYYKKIDDKNKQLYYINKLFKVDSILDSNYKNLSKKIVLEYDTPRLLEEKQALIDNLEAKEKKTSIKFIVAVIIAGILIIIAVWIYTKNIRYRKRFQELMYNEEKVGVTQEEANQKSATTPEAIGVSEAIVADILKGLSRFEEEQGFLQANITTNELAKKLKTNSKYLSKTINTYKQKSFSVYINELRIDYVIQKLKEDSKFRLYTIKAIARDIGFNTTEAFSKSFYKKTGIYPSYFIKQLERGTIVS